MMRSLPELQKPVWHSEDSVQISGSKMEWSLTPKAVVLPVLLYACETWTVYQRHARRRNHFHKAVEIRWQDKIPDTEVLKKAGMQSMHTVLELVQLRWTGNVIRMPGPTGWRLLSVATFTKTSKPGVQKLSFLLSY